LPVALLMRQALLRVRKPKKCLALVQEWRALLLGPRVSANDNWSETAGTVRAEALKAIDTACAMCGKDCPRAGTTRPRLPVVLTPR
jgi:hypothetical protein